jgi:hypothetical protein
MQNEEGKIGVLLCLYREIKFVLDHAMECGTSSICVCGDGENKSGLLALH